MAEHPGDVRGGLGGADVDRDLFAGRVGHAEQAVVGAGEGDRVPRPLPRVADPGQCGRAALLNGAGRGRGGDAGPRSGGGCLGAGDRVRCGGRRGLGGDGEAAGRTGVPGGAGARRGLGAGAGFGRVGWGRYLGQGDPAGTGRVPTGRGHDGAENSEEADGRNQRADSTPAPICRHVVAHDIPSPAKRDEAPRSSENDRSERWSGRGCSGLPVISRRKLWATGPFVD